MGLKTSQTFFVLLLTFFLLITFSTAQRYASKIDFYTPYSDIPVTDVGSNIAITRTTYSEEIDFSQTRFRPIISLQPNIITGELQSPFGLYPLCKSASTEEEKTQLCPSYGVDDIAELILEFYSSRTLLHYFDSTAQNQTPLVRLKLATFTGKLTVFIVTLSLNDENFSFYTHRQLSSPLISAVSKTIAVTPPPKLSSGNEAFVQPPKIVSPNYPEEEFPSCAEWRNGVESSDPSDCVRLGPIKVYLPQVSPSDGHWVCQVSGDLLWVYQLNIKIKISNSMPSDEFGPYYPNSKTPPTDSSSLMTLNCTGQYSFSQVTNCLVLTQELPPQDLSLLFSEQNTALPLPSFSLTGKCDFVIDVNGQMISYSEILHANMCAIPSAGSLKVDKYTEQNVCDCKCKGLWVDNPQTTDNMKCTLCSLQCPQNQVPNRDCTQCTCIDENNCKQQSFAFTTVNLDPALLFEAVRLKTSVMIAYRSLSSELDLFLRPDGTTLADPVLLTNAILNRQNPDAALFYEQLVPIVANFFTQYYQSLYYDSNGEYNLQFPTYVTSVTASPLVETSLHVLKLKLDLINTSENGEDFSNLNNFGIPRLENLPGTQITQQLAEYIMNNFLIGSFEDEISYSTILNFFTSLISITPTVAMSDILTTRCVTEVVHENTTDLFSITISDTPLSCPLPEHYIVLEDPTREQELNPLWSKCALQTFSKYEQIFITDQLVDTTISVGARQIFPICFDFMGVNVAKYGIPCQYTHLPLYSTRKDDLLPPFITHLALQPFAASESLNELEITRATIAASHIPILFPSFPSLPQVTWMLCEHLTNDIQPTPSTLQISPNRISPNQHMHLTWGFLGYPDQTVTFNLKPTLKPPVTPDNNTLLSNISDQPAKLPRFPFSMNLGTFSGSNLYAPITKKERSDMSTTNLLLELLYKYMDTISDFIGMYHNVAVELEAYLTKNAHTVFSGGTYLRTDNTGQMRVNSLESESQNEITDDFNTIIFSLPLLCDIHNIRCAAENTACNQLYGRCECKYGYVHRGSTIRYADSVDVFGDSLVCEEWCNNNGSFDFETEMCVCPPLTLGERCEIIIEPQCNPHLIANAAVDPIVYHDPHTLRYYFPAVYHIDPDTNDSELECLPLQCLNHWTDPRGTQEEGTCGACPLQDTRISSDLDAAEIPYVQTYEDSTCYVPGTKFIDNCKTCVCNDGYTGYYCQLHVMYARFNTSYIEESSSVIDSQAVNSPFSTYSTPTYLNDHISQLLFRDKFLTELSLSFTRPAEIRKQLFIHTYNMTGNFIIVGFNSSLDFFTENYARSSMKILDDTIDPPITHPSNQMSDLYLQWLALQNSYSQSPLNNQQSSDYANGISPPSDIHDPACVKYYGAQTCQDNPGVLYIPGDGGGGFIDDDVTSPSSPNISIIIGVVIGVAGGVILLFAIVICSVRWAKKTESCCWAKPKQVIVATNSTTKTLEMSHGLSVTSPRSQIASVQSTNGQVEIEVPNLPSDWKAYQNDKNKIFYVNQLTMISSWKHPITGDGEDDNGW